jgi:hypothetical protein
MGRRARTRRTPAARHHLHGRHDARDGRHRSLHTIKAMHPEIVIVMVTGSPAWITSANRFEGGASGFIIKPFNAGKVLDTVRRAWAAKSPAARRQAPEARTFRSCSSTRAARQTRPPHRPPQAPGVAPLPPLPVLRSAGRGCSPSPSRSSMAPSPSPWREPVPPPPPGFADDDYRAPPPAQSAGWPRCIHARNRPPSRPAAPPAAPANRPSAPLSPRKDVHSRRRTRYRHRTGSLRHNTRCVPAYVRAPRAPETRCHRSDAHRLAAAQRRGDAGDRLRRRTENLGRVVRQQTPATPP